MVLFQRIRRLFHHPVLKPDGNPKNVTEILPTVHNNGPHAKDGMPKEKAPNTDKVPLFGDHSPLWRLYLEGATAEAKASVDLCQTAIDSLLIFAGLFGAVLASFIVDSRSELTPDADRFILADIRSHLQRETPAKFTTEPLVALINGLWFTSLLLTLFATILGGIAKSWFVKFATPTRQQEAGDAYKRWVLDLRRWYLERVIATMPLLLHISLLLFAAGFGLQAHSDNPTIGWFCLVLVALGIIVYIGLTLLSIWNQRVLLPLNTPLTDLLVGINELVYDHSPRHDIDKDAYLPRGPHTFAFEEKKDKDNVLAVICRRHILSSSNPLYVDTAVIEITPLPDEWLAYFIQHGVAERSIERIKTCMEPSAHLENEQMRDHTLRNHLKALLAFRAWKNRQTAHSETSRKLSRVLEDFVCDFLGRWNTLPEAVRPLVFSIRANVFLDLTEPRDFHAEETEDLSWEIIHKHSMHSMQRLNFALAACCGIWADSHLVPRLQDTCLLSLCLSTVYAAHRGQTSEWQDSAPRNEVSMQGEKQLRQSFGLLVSKCETILWQHLKDFQYDRFGFAGTHEGSKESAFPVGTVVDLAVAFLHCDPSIRKREVHTIHALIEDTPSCENPALQSALLHMALNDEDKGVRDQCRESLSKMHKSVSRKYQWCFTDSQERQQTSNFIISKPLRDWESGRLDDLEHVLLEQVSSLLPWIDSPMDLMVSVIVPLTITSCHARIRKAGRSCLKAYIDNPSSGLSSERLKGIIQQALRDQIPHEARKGVVTSQALIVIEELDQFHDMRLGLNIFEHCLESVIHFALNCRGNCNTYGESCKTTICGRGDCPRTQRAWFLRIFQKWAATPHIAQNFGHLLEEKIARIDVDKFVTRADAVESTIYWIDLLERLAAQGQGDADQLHGSSGESASSSDADSDPANITPFTTARNRILDSLDRIVAQKERDSDTKIDLISSLMRALTAMNPSHGLHPVLVRHFLSICEQKFPSSSSSADRSSSPEVDREHPEDKLCKIILNGEVGPRIQAIALSVYDTIVRDRKIRRRDVSAITNDNMVAQATDAEVQKAWIRCVTAPSMGAPEDPILARIGYLLCQSKTVEVRCTAVEALAYLRRSYPKDTKCKEWVEENMKKLFGEVGAETSTSSKGPDADKHVQLRVQLALVENDLCSVQQLIHFISQKQETHDGEAQDRLRSRALQKLATRKFGNKDLEQLETMFCDALRPKPGRPRQRDQAFASISLLLVERDKPITPERHALEEETLRILSFLRGLPEKGNIKHKIYASMPDINLREVKIAILACLPDIIPNLGNTDAKRVVRDIFSDRHIANMSQKDFPFAATDAIRILKDGRWHHRQVVIELVAAGCQERGNNVGPPWSTHDFVSIIDELVMLAIDSHDYDLRPQCLEVLVDVCKREELFLRRVRGYRARLLPLLEIRSLRTPAAKLISLLCKDPIVREKVARWILRTFTQGRENENEGLAELLSRLILDKVVTLRHSGWKNDNPTLAAEQDQVLGLDYVLVLLALVLMMRPPLHAFQYQLASALWGNHHGLDIDKRKGQIEIPRPLTDWFFSVVFSKHVTELELEEWKAAIQSQSNQQLRRPIADNLPPHLSPIRNRPSGHGRGVTSPT
ncbi:hypothetical protein BKA70DRAFT_1254915 [Coprinopsis sp. MPI-PUGE-AT-0042]|nr:hypothetical protein BKA70DRAFT_1254915 [Coprinopsis sp. MPI-PUGE-AT-0042]